MKLKDYLEEMTTSSWGENSLPAKLSIAGIKTAVKRKSSMVAALHAYLSEKKNILKIWNSLDACEKELMEEYIRSGGALDEDEANSILKKHKQEKKKAQRLSTFFSSYADRITSLLDEQSPARLFFLPHAIPPSILKVLKKLIKPVEVRLSPVAKIPKKQITHVLQIGETFEKDIINVLKLINSTKLKTTAGSGMPTKASALKINEVLENKDVVLSSYGKLEKIRLFEQTNRMHGLIQLLYTHGLAEEKSGILVLTPRASSFLMLSPQDMSTELFHTYIDAGSINELDRMREIRIQTEQRPLFKTARETIVKYFRYCSRDTWYELSELQSFIKKNDRQFLTKATGRIETYDEFDRYYYLRREPWEDIEGRFIDIMLLEYLSTLGLVDLALTEEESEYTGLEYFKVKYFKLTALGAYIFRLTDEYDSKAKTENSGFIVQPNYEIVITEGRMKYTHVLFFDRFADVLSADAVHVYKLNFKGIVRALDKGIKPEEITAYIKAHSENTVPENVLLTLQEWEQESKRIKIRTVTIVETDDKYLLEEIRNLPQVSSHILKSLPHAFEIETGTGNKVKREIEKKNRFCLLEEQYACHTEK